MDYIDRLRESEKRNQQVVVMKLGGMRNIDIARHFGITRQRVQKIISTHLAQNGNGGKEKVAA
jgi:transposase